MNDRNSQSVNDAESDAGWPRKLNKALIGVGIIAFGLIITDRLVNMFQADDLPDVAEVQRTQDASSAVQEPEAQTTSALADTAGTDAPSSLQEQEAVAIEDIFGSPVVFVSLSEPSYVITEDERRIDIGGQIDEQTTLAGITSQQVIFERDGNLEAVTLPDPAPASE